MSYFSDFHGSDLCFFPCQIGRHILSTRFQEHGRLFARVKVAEGPSNGNSGIIALETRPCVVITIGCGKSHASLQKAHGKEVSGRHEKLCEERPKSVKSRNSK